MVRASTSRSRILFYGGKQLLIHPVFHIADGDIRMGAFTGCHDFNGKLWIADPSADQRRIKYKGFHKSVSGTPHYLILFRFTDPLAG